MLRFPKVGPSAPGRGGPALAPPPQQQQKKVIPVISSADLLASNLSSPPMRVLPAATYFAQVYPQSTVVAPLPRGSCLYATPHGPEIRTMRATSTGKLPVNISFPFLFSLPAYTSLLSSETTNVHCFSLYFVVGWVYAVCGFSNPETYVQF